MHRLSGPRRALFTLMAVTALGACGKDDEILPGQRFDIDVPLAQTRPEAADEVAAEAGTRASATADRAEPIDLPEQVAHAAWGHRNGTAQHRLPHPALDPPLEIVWTADIGQGDTRRHRITASPVAGDGRIFTLDAQATVRAFSLETGEQLWSVDMTPSGEKSESASGGALTLAEGRLYVTTGFGVLAALDPQTGSAVWRRREEAPMSGGVTVEKGTLYGVSRDSRAWALDAETGRVRWEIPGVPAEAVVTGGPAPALTSTLVIFPFGSGDLVATLRQNGIRVWQGSVSGRRRGLARASITDITGDPVVAGGAVYVGNQAGRTLALNAASGELIWTVDEGALGPVWPEGDSIFQISDRNSLLRLDAADGSRIWEAELPNFVNAGKPQHRWDSVVAHHGPVLAGGVVWIASSDGLLRGFDPVSGDQVAEHAVRDGAASAPIVVNRTLYVVSQGGELLAFR